MYSTAHQATTRPSSQKEGEVSEGARRDFHPGHNATLKFNAAHSDECGQTMDVESESEKTGHSSVRVLKSRSVPASDVPLTSSRATVGNVEADYRQTRRIARHLCDS